MRTYIILTWFSPEAFRDTTGFKKLAETMTAKITFECPGVRWKESFSTHGRFDVVDVMEADEVTEAEKAAMIIRPSGHAVTETLVGTPWKEFLAAL